LIFPPSAGYYNALLLVPIFVFWKEALPKAQLLVIAYIAALYGLLVYSTILNIVAPLSIWMICAAMMLRSRARVP